MIDRLLSDEFKGKTVLISWNHNGMVPLAKAFGATCVPEKWKGKRFDITWVIGEDKRLIQLPQLLLHGDEDTVMKVEDSACSHIQYLRKLVKKYCIYVIFQLSGFWDLLCWLFNLAIYYLTSYHAFLFMGNHYLK